MNYSTKGLGKSFWSFFLVNLRSPVNQGFRVEGQHFLHGLITLGIYVLITSFSTFLQTIMFSRGITSFGFQIKSFFSTFLLPFFSTAIFLLVLVGIMFLIARLMGSNVDYSDVAARFGALMVIPVVFNVISLLFTMMNANASFLYFFVSLLGMISFLTAITYTIFSFRGTGTGIDPFYGVILTFVAIGVLLLIFKDAIFQGMFSIIY